MKYWKQMLSACVLFPLVACGGGNQSNVQTEQALVATDSVNQVIETILARRSVRKYKPQPVEREKMQTIVECGVNAPNAMNRQPWEIRVVDNPDFINGVTELYKKEQPKVAEDPNFKNMFRNAPTVVFVGRDVQSGSAEFDVLHSFRLSR